MSVGFIAVHVGAGYHSEEKRHKYEKVCKQACMAAVELLNKNCRATDAACEAVRILEDSPLTNAGTGSNLTISGNIECDASVMDGKSLNFGAVGALSGFRNPILIARQVFSQQSEILPLGRIPPCLLVGSGAHDWAVENGFAAVPSDSLCTSRVREAYTKNKRKLDAVSVHNKRLCFAGSKEQMLDTVGAICIDGEGNIASAVSSGGLVLKQDGRVGQAATYGCGCWAQNSQHSTESSVAVTTTGVGEYLVKTIFARECSEAVASKDSPTEALHQTFLQKFLKSPFLAKCKDKHVGALVVKCDQQVCDLMWAHTTNSMCLGYMASNSRKCQTVLSRLSGTTPESVELGGVVIRLEH